MCSKTIQECIGYECWLVNVNERKKNCFQGEWEDLYILLANVTGWENNLKCWKLNYPVQGWQATVLVMSKSFSFKEKCHLNQKDCIANFRLHSLNDTIIFRNGKGTPRCC